MTPEIRAKLLALGPELAPPMLQGTSTLLASIAAPTDPAVEIIRDRHYGPHERNRLDLFRRGAPSNATVLAYVHGGGFVMGDKTREGSPFYDNVGQWAAQQGWLGVTLTYRLAPQHLWPCGPEDMGAAVRWLREHAAQYGGDPEKIILMGQSAGGAHVAAYVANERFHAGARGGVAAAIMISGLYDAMTQPPDQFSDAYYGTGNELRAQARSVDGLVAAQLPLLFTVSEFDPRDFQDQAMQLAQAWYQRRGSYPPMEFLAGHNHLSPAQTLGSSEEQFAVRVKDFVAVVSAR